MSYAIVNLLLTVIDIYWWIVIASFVISWLIAFDVINTRSQAVYSVRRALAALTEPVYEPVSYTHLLPGSQTGTKVARVSVSKNLITL